MADSLVNSALLKLEGMAFGAVKQQTEVGKKAQGLKDDLAWLRLLLRDADQRRRQEINEYIELWVRQTREVAFDAEDLLDEYLHEGCLHCRGVLDLPSLLRWLRRSASGLFIRQSICADIDAIKERLEQIKKKTEDNNVKLQILPATTTSDKRRKRHNDWTALNKSKIDKLVWVNGILKKIEKCLDNQGEQRSRTVVAITGKSGVGKTTLARCVYESSKIRAQFHYIIWVHVPKKFRLVDVISDMARQMTIPGMELDPEWKDPQDINELTKRLSSKEYLIVLDDVHTLDDLKLFLSVLPECKGSVVVITTEAKHHHASSGASSIDDVRYTCGKLKKLCDHQVVLQKLKKEEAGEMFCRKVFGTSSFHGALKSDAHAKAIEDLLDNSLPLAGTLLAGLLRTKKWEVWVDVINQLTQHRLRLEQQVEQQEKQINQPQLKEAQEANQQLAGQLEEMKKVREQQPVEEKEADQQENMHKRQWQIEEELEADPQSQGQQKGMKQKQQQQEEAVQDKPTEENKEPEIQQEQHVYRLISLLDQILMLSFDDLPPHLKQCFLYFSAFRAEEHINTDKLIRLWVAEGLVQPTDGRTMEKHGRDYLRVLISRSLVNVVKKDYSNNIITITIHERVLAFARSEAHEINFLQVHHNTTDLPSTAIRRLAVQNAFNPHTRLALTTPKLRSLLCECPQAPGAIDSSSLYSRYIHKPWRYIAGRVISLSIHQCKFLRVVDIQGMAQRSSLPYEIGSLIYLRYLGLAHTGLKKLPRSIKNLSNLQTLDITGTKIEQLPKGLWKIKALRHVLAEQVQNGPSQDNTLHNLQTLHGVYCKDSALKKLINLRALGLWGIGKHPDLEDCLGKMECLRALDLAAEGGVKLSLFKLLTMLGLRNLQHLKLNCKLLRTTEKYSSEASHSYLLHSLAKLELYNSGLEQKDINLIAKMPNLADLILGEDSYTEKDMVIPAKGFPELKKLHINKLPKLEKISVAEDGSSTIEQLQEILNLEDGSSALEQLQKISNLKDGSSALKRLQEISNLEGGSSTLKQLQEISNLEGGSSALEQLQEISILNCEALKEIPCHLQTLKDLVLLAVNNCPNIGNLSQKSSNQIRENLIIFRQ